MPQTLSPRVDGPLVVKLRRRGGITQKALAESAGISPQYLADIEAGRRKGANPAVAFGIAKALGVPVDAITTADAA